MNHKTIGTLALAALVLTVLPGPPAATALTDCVMREVTPGSTCSPQPCEPAASCYLDANAGACKHGDEPTPCLAYCPQPEAGAVVDGVSACRDLSCPTVHGVGPCIVSRCAYGAGDAADCLTNPNGGAGCYTGSTNRLWHAHAECSWFCPANAGVALAVLAGTVGAPGKSEGNAGCGRVSCRAPTGPGCSDYGSNDGLAVPDAQCTGDHYGAGLVNVFVVCAAFGCGPPCDSSTAGSTATFIIGDPLNDLSAVHPGDQMCLPTDTGPQCMTIQPESVNFFSGPTIPSGGVRCHADACSPVEFQD